MATLVTFIGLVAALACVAVTVAATDDMEKDYEEEEFEYFYNMELLEKMELLTNNKTEIDEEVLRKLAEDDLEYEDTTEIDNILDELLEEGNLIEQVLDEIDAGSAYDITLIGENNSSTDMFNQILFYVLLISFVIMFLISSVATFLCLYKRNNTNNESQSVEDRKEISFIFIPGKNKMFKSEIRSNEARV